MNTQRPRGWIRVSEEELVGEVDWSSQEGGTWGSILFRGPGRGGLATGPWIDHGGSLAAGPWIDHGESPATGPWIDHGGALAAGPWIDHGGARLLAPG